MVRSTSNDLQVLDLASVRPLVGADRPELASALHALVTWGTATTSRQALMHHTGFPFPDDLPAFLVINQLIYRGSARPTDLAEAIDTGRSNISKILRRLEAADLVLRGPDPQDNRGVVVVLTEQGRDLGRRILAANSAAQVFQAWDSDDLATFERLVLKLARDLDALPHQPISAATGLDFSHDDRTQQR